MTGLDWKPVSALVASYGWAAFTKHDGLDVQVTVTSGTGTSDPRFCPCPGECTRPGVPYVLVTAAAFVRMETTAWATHVDLAEWGRQVHVPGGTEDQPGDTVGDVAARLIPVAAAEARVTLAELAAHAARLGIKPENEVTRA